MRAIWAFPKALSFLASCLAVFLAGQVCAAAPLPQSTLVREDHKLLGIAFFRPRRYEQIPVPPDVPFAVLKFVEVLPEDSAQWKRSRPELRVLWIDWDPEEPTAPGWPAPELEDGPRPSATSRAAARALAMVDSLESYVELQLPGWKLLGAAPGEGRYGHSAETFELRRADDVHDILARGWVCAYHKAPRTIALMGFCEAEDFAEQSRLWRQSAERIRFFDPVDNQTKKLTRHYARAGLIDSGHRIAVRKRLIPGWESADTEHYIAVSHSPDEQLLRKICKDIELLRAEYERVFPPLAPVTAVSTLRLCRDRAEYILYGGTAATSGYWNERANELVFYDAVIEERGRRSDDTETFVTLYHEAFHQYIHYSAGELEPHPWFNEGLADYFGGARIRSGKLRGIGPHPQRLARLGSGDASRALLSLERLLEASSEDLFARNNLGYALAWSLVYFLQTAPEARREPTWVKILPTYFQSLKLAWAEERKKLESRGDPEDAEALAAARRTARETALTRALADVDLPGLQLAWREFVAGLAEE